MTEVIPVAMSESKTIGTDKAVVHGEDVERGSPGILDDNDGISLGKGDILGNEHTDPVLSQKMHLINNVSQTYVDYSSSLNFVWYCNYIYMRECY
jgi:hypothetical protein